MKARNIFGMLVSLAALVMAGCGGGGGGVAATTSGTTVNGVATKGPIRNGHYQAFQIYSSHDPAKSRLSDTPFFSGVTDDKGNYSFQIPEGMRRGGLLVKVVDGTYTDEATGVDKHVETEYPAGMRAAYGNISGAVRRGDRIRTCVTPYTELAVKGAGAKLDDNAVKGAHDMVEHAFGLDDKGVDIVHTQPLDPNLAFPADASAAQKAYALALATMSEYEKDFGGGAKLGAISDDLLANHISKSGALDDATKSQIGTSMSTYVDDKGGKTNPDLKDPTLNTNAPAKISTDPSTPATASVNTSVTITANITNKAGTSVPDGTKVNFVTSVGTLSAASAKTINGNVSVTLTSATAGSGTVTVSAGAASDPTGTINFVDPNAPAGITLSASPGTGSTSPLAGPVVISADVTRAAGGSVLDGTSVAFAVSSGAGTLSKQTATTVNGIATVNLTCTVVGATIVTATAGTASNTVTANFIAQPTKAIVKLSTVGVGAGTLIGGMNVTLTLPAGVTLQKNPDNSTASGVCVTSGVAAASGALSIGNAANPGSVTIGMITTSGFGGGEFVTVNADIASGTFPTPGDFTVALVGNVITTTSVVVPNVALSAALTLQ